MAPLSPDDDTDYNKLDRAFYDALDDYARAFDDWCDAEGDYRIAEFGGQANKTQAVLPLQAIAFRTGLYRLLDPSPSIMVRATD